jgi:hypothetical protein
MQRQEKGRWILSAVAVSMISGGVLADWNRTHLLNPRWTPHARFHDAWSILLTAGMGATALYLLWRRRAEPGIAAALLAEVAAAQGLSYSFPGAGGVAAEFPDIRTRPGLTKIPEWLVSSAALATTATGWWLCRTPRP